jgi:hypothetical protein
LVVGSVYLILIWNNSLFSLRKFENIIVLVILVLVYPDSLDQSRKHCQDVFASKIFSQVSNDDSCPSPLHHSLHTGMHRKSIEAAEKLRSDSEEDGDDMLSIDGDDDRREAEKAMNAKNQDKNKDDSRTNGTSSPVPNCNSSQLQESPQHKVNKDIDNKPLQKKPKERVKKSPKKQTPNQQTNVELDHSLSSSPSNTSHSNDHFSHHQTQLSNSQLNAFSSSTASPFGPMMMRDDSWSSSIANLRAKALEHQAKVLSQVLPGQHLSQHPHHPVHHHHSVLSSSHHSNGVLNPHHHPSVLISPPSTASSSSPSSSSVSPPMTQRTMMNTTLSHLYSTFDPTKVVPSYPLHPPPSTGRPIY